jgi:uncharacterized protein (TIGR03437 family)
MGGMSVLVNSTPTPLYYTSYNQVAFQMPVDTPLGTNLVQVKRDDATSNKVSVQVVAHAPRLISNVFNQDGTINDSAHPTHIGDTVVIYAFGMGATNPGVATGATAPSVEPLARLTETPMVIFGTGLFAPNSRPGFAGLTPGLVGVYQLNVIVPDGTPKGASSLAVAFSDANSNALTLYVQ